MTQKAPLNRPSVFMNHVGRFLKRSPWQQAKPDENVRIDCAHIQLILTHSEVVDAALL